LVRRVLRVRLALKVSRVQSALKVRLAILDPLALTERLVLSVPLVRMVLLVPKVNPDRLATTELRESRGLLDHKVISVLLATLGLKVPRAMSARWDQSACRVIKVCPAHREIQVLSVLRDQRDHRVLPVMARVRVKLVPRDHRVR